MKNLQDIIKLCQGEQGKVFIMNEQGNIELVVMGLDEYKSMKTRKPEVSIKDIDRVNRQIIQAQLEEEQKPIVPKVLVQEVPKIPKSVDMREEVIDPSFDFDSPEDDI